MKTKSIRKYNIVLIGVLAVLLLFLGAFLATGSLDRAEASGNIAYPPDGQYDLTLNLDVNGADATTVLEDSVENVNDANSKSYKRRKISLGALLASYASNVSNNVSEPDKVRYNPSNYRLSGGSETAGVYNSFSAFVSVEKISSGGVIQALRFSALKYKMEPKAFVGIEFDRVDNGNTTGLPQKITVYINFNIQSTFVPAEKSPDYQSNQHIDDKSFYLAGDSDGTASRLEIKNNSVATFDLADLKGAKLQYKDTEGKLVDLKQPLDNSQFWTLSDVSYFTVTSGTIGDIIESSRIKASSDQGSSPKILIDAYFTESQVINFNRVDPDGQFRSFWDATHYLRITISNQSGTQSVTISKRVSFASSGAPTYKDKREMPVALNATSPYQFTSKGNYVMKGDKTAQEQPADGSITNTGYSQVRVKPSYLCDFPSKGKQYFNAASVADELKISDASKVNVEVVFKKDADGNELSEVDYCLVTAINNGSSEVTFPIKYTTSAAADSEVKSMDVTVAFTVYGKFDMTPITMKGKKVVKYNTISHDYFRPIVNKQFYLVSVGFSDDQSNSRVQFEFENNELTLTPLASGEAVLKLGFKNQQDQQIFIDWTIRLNYEGGSIFATWETIYVVLFFIGIGIVGLILILFIVWLFIRSLSKRKQEENATTAPTSAYIIKWSSTIAAAQAQQRLATTQAFNAAQTQMLALGAGPTSTGAPNPNTLQLGAAAPAAANGGAMSMPPDINSINIGASQPPTVEEIYIPLSDDELLERIFVEKYEPRGMARRSFFKSKDLQSRELEKEKTRIRDDVRGGMTIEEACKSLSERQSMQSGTPAAESETPVTDSTENIIVNILGFDPDSPLVSAADAPVVEITEDMSAEEKELKNAENRMERIEKELKTIEERLEKTKLEIDKAQKAIESTESTITLKEESNISLKKNIEDLEFKLATAKNKDKDKLLKDIDNKEHVIAANKDIISKLQDELTLKRGNMDNLNAILVRYEDSKRTSDEDYEKAKKDCEEAKENYRIAQELLEKAKKAQETKGKLEKLRPMLEKVNVMDVDIRKLVNQIEKNTKEKDAFKADVSDLQKQMLNTDDVSAVNELSGKMSALNKQVSQLDKAIAADNKAKADKTIAFNGERRKANEFIDREVIEVEDVIREEDDVISKMAFEEYMARAQQERKEAEANLSALQSRYDELVGSYDTSVMDIAVKTAAAVKEAEEALAQTNLELEEINAKMETASDDDKLMLSIDQMSAGERLEQQQKQLDELKAGATKEKVEYQMSYEKRLEETKQELEEAQKLYDEASKKVDESLNKVNPLDLILSGSGVISQDRQKLEAENLKKQLELSKSAMEQAKLQAKMAQMEAEKAIIDAQRASDASKAEAERLAQEAIAKAEEAKTAAEQKASEEAEKARQEIERAKQEAEEEKRRAAEEAERIRKEAEEARLEAERKAAEEMENVKKEAEEARVEAERKAAEEAEKAKKEAESEAERIRREAEEEKKKAEAEIEQNRIEREKEQERINKKVAAKKAHILEMRKSITDITDEASARVLKEKFYTELVNLDEDEKTSAELKNLINKSMDDVVYAGEISLYKDMAHKEPKRIVKKVTERVNRIPKSPGQRPRSGSSRPASARPAGARPAGARPAGARPAGARPGAARPGAARPAGTRPTTRTGARPTSARPKPTGSPRPRPNKPKQ